MPGTLSDTELKARHRAMWASGDYASMVETFLLPLGPRLVEACRIVPGMHVLDVGAGSGNASIPAAQRGASVTASDLTPELLDAGRELAEGAARARPRPPPGPPRRGRGGGGGRGRRRGGGGGGPRPPAVRRRLVRRRH